MSFINRKSQLPMVLINGVTWTCSAEIREGIYKSLMINLLHLRPIPLIVSACCVNLPALIPALRLWLPGLAGETFWWVRALSWLPPPCMRPPGGSSRWHLQPVSGDHCWSQSFLAFRGHPAGWHGMDFSFRCCGGEPLFGAYRSTEWVGGFGPHAWWPYSPELYPGSEGQG